MSYRGLGQATITTVTRTEQVPAAPSVSVSDMSDGVKYAIGLGTFAVLGGLGYLAYKYPSPMIGGGGMGYGYGGGYGGRPGVMLTMNRRRRR